MRDNRWLVLLLMYVVVGACILVGGGCTVGWWKSSHTMKMVTSTKTGELSHKAVRIMDSLGMGSGTGIFIRDNIILTAKHVVQPVVSSLPTTVYLQDGRTLRTTEVYVSSEYDLAVVVVSTPEVEPTVQFDRAVLGEPIVIVGMPLRHYPYCTSGIVSSLSQSTSDDPNSPTFTWTDAHTAPGGSGGAMFDSDGNLLGVTVQMSARFAGFVAVVPSEDVVVFLDNFMANKEE